jgi:hypothetical protein
VAETENERVSREAHDRVTAERDQFKQQVEAAAAALADMQAREKARAFFKAQGAADPDIAAEAAFPHLRGIEPEKFDEVLGKDIFKPYLAASLTNGQAVTDEPAVEPTSGFSGPSPGSAGNPVTGATATYSELRARGFTREQIIAESQAGRAVPDDKTLAALKGQAEYRQRGR